MFCRKVGLRNSHLRREKEKKGGESKWGVG